MQAGRAVVFQHMLASPANYLPRGQGRAAVAQRRWRPAMPRTGLTDGLISDPRACAFDAGIAAVRRRRRPDCLTAGAGRPPCRQIYGGVKDAGRQGRSRHGSRWATRAAPRAGAAGSPAPSRRPRSPTARWPSAPNAPSRLHPDGRRTSASWRSTTTTPGFSLAHVPLSSPTCRAWRR